MCLSFFFVHDSEAILLENREKKNDEEAERKIRKIEDRGRGKRRIERNIEDVRRNAQDFLRITMMMMRICH